ncbi:hypothetical protein [Paenibacillus rhizophilus]|uniref:Uncharacterized protein n=1 Tax=Paenibacillus rhizophilus TaxID=1850366 RepID=A0A3N9P2S7_9BACL|nr:hypothetical protein [Paenibacillus rhizophilus]RQW10039.1 hypothetical protein EH198_16525 [Paenibacillus rhizophilus]
MEETANHSGIEQQETPVTETVTESIETPVETSPPQEEPRGIKVKYNKEERFVPEDEVPNWVQKGLNYDKVSEKAKEAERYQQILDRTAKFYGFETHEQYMEALEQAETDRRIQQEADRLGVPEEVIREYVQPLKSELDQLKQKDQQRAEADAIRQVEQQIASMEADAASYPDFTQHKAQVINLAAERGYSLEDAYKIVTYDSRIQTAQQQAQQEAIRKLQQNADSSTGALGADSPDTATGYMSMSPAERKAFRDAVKRGQTKGV